MKKNITNSIEQLLYKKLSDRIEETRKEIASSIFESQYKGDPEVERLATPSSEEDEDPNEKYREQYKKCQEKVADKNPKATKKQLEKLVKDCMDKQ